MAQELSEGEISTTESLSSQQERVDPIRRTGYYGRYPRWIGHKFEPDGRVRQFPGHGIMCPLPVESAMHHALQDFYVDLKKQDFASSLTLLPPSVWHMTVYEGVSDQIRRRDCWPGQLSPDDCSLEQCTKFVGAQLKKFNVGYEPRFRMAPVGWESIKDGITLKVVGVNVAEERKLRDLRDRLGELLQLRHPGFEMYSFHIGIAYQLRLLAEGVEEHIGEYLQAALERFPKEFELGVPQFCTYEDMFALERQFDLAE